jgi:diadenylate cyclase
LDSELISGALGFLPLIADIVLVAVLFYYILKSVRGTKVAVVLQAAIVIGLIYFACRALDLITLLVILNAVIYLAPIALLVVFAPEVRKFFEELGRTSRMFSMVAASGAEGVDESVLEPISEAVMQMSETKTGALIIIETGGSVDDSIVAGTELDAQISEKLLLSIFNLHNPMHDGAVLIRDERIHSAGNILPISENTELDGSLGSRHRAALGLSERSEAVVIAVSEETGGISIAHRGRLARPLSGAQFVEQLGALAEPNEVFATLVPRMGTV